MLLNLATENCSLGKKLVNDISSCKYIVTGSLIIVNKIRRTIGWKKSI